MPVEGKKHILSSACTKWRQFKFKLRTKFLNPLEDRRPLFDNPPKNYPFIKKKMLGMPLSVGIVLQNFKNGVGFKVKKQKAMSIDIIHLGMDLLMWKKR